MVETLRKMYRYESRLSHFSDAFRAIHKLSRSALPFTSDEIIRGHVLIKARTLWRTAQYNHNLEFLATRCYDPLL